MTAETGAWPRVVLVTDRRRLLAVPGMAHPDWESALTAQIRGAVAGGVDLIQLREPDLPAGSLAAFLRRLFAEVPASREVVIVNERLDVALATRAAGVHLPERSLRPGDVAQLAPSDKQFVIGRSVHGPEAAAASTGATYLLAGTVLSTRSKPPGWVTMGWPGLTTVVAASGDIPVVAIGGLSVGEVPLVRAAGAAGLAAISYFVPEGRGDLTEFVQERVETMRLAFDTLDEVPYTHKTDR